VSSGAWQLRILQVLDFFCNGHQIYKHEAALLLGRTSIASMLGCQRESGLLHAYILLFVLLF
jgi:hypothetical protein